MSRPKLQLLKDSCLSMTVPSIRNFYSPLTTTYNNIIYADGNFYTCPPIFEQLCTLHALIDGEMFQLFFSLLSEKSEDICTRFFSLLETASTQMPDSTESANFLRRFRICCTEFCQIIFSEHCYQRLFLALVLRKVQSTGVVTNYKGEPDIH
ncbi:unnamed protein product [Mytilus edulis]|uniref:Uncharacterized protein n=1 Tax=Mytilus edulis TaxID=6550 RepID=A0A8S3TF59_MYTED|nr:unnamed protein product [Mytilus edulis]